MTTGPAVALGVDAGSTTCKLVAVDVAGDIVGWRLAQATPRVEIQSQEMLADLRSAVATSSDVAVVATGYGRKMVRAADRDVTEITCHARGVYADLGQPGTLVDIGGQDSKVIRIGKGGNPIDFAMNDKCAAGTGRFLEHTASRLGVPLDDLGPTALSATSEEAISSTCTVFAESEIISLIARGAELPNILLGLHRALVSRILAMVRAVGLEPPLLLSGGVARNVAMRELLAQEAGTPVLLPSQPQLMGAYGAALVGARGLRADRPREQRPAVPVGGGADCPPGCR